MQTLNAGKLWSYSLFKKRSSTLTSLVAAGEPGHRNVRKKCPGNKQQAEGIWTLEICDDIQQRWKANTLEYVLKFCLNYHDLQSGYATGLRKSAERKSITNGR